MRVLIADDSRVMRKIFRGALEAMKIPEHDVLEAADGAEAVRVLAETRPEFDLVIADWDLAGMDGIAFHRHLRGSHMETPILYCIGRDQRIPSMNQLRGAEFIERPFRDEVFQEVVRRLGADVKAKRTQAGSDVLRSVVSAAEVELPFLIRLPTRMIEEFLKLSVRERHPAGKELFAHDDIVDFLHVLTSGQVELVEANGKVVQTCMDGDCFGEFSFMLNQPSRVGARAKTPIEVASLSRSALGELVRRHPSMADYLSTLMARRWKKTGTTRITRGENELMGSLQSMPFADVVQLLHVTQKTGVLGLREGDESGGMYFQGGEVTHAWVGELKGEEAFYKMSAWTKARFGFNSVPRKEPQTVEQPTMTLLMEAMRRLDEAAGKTAPPPAGNPLDTIE
jgi:two-component system chemotaxis response regulator CheY